MPRISPPPHTGENELLLVCARTQMSHLHREQVSRLIQEDLNWAYLLATAAQHGILQLLFHNLSGSSDKIPPPFWSQLRTFYMTNALRNQFLGKELITLLRDFRSEGISAIPFKGPALAAMAYGDLSLREFIDLDILVHQWQLSQAFTIMKAKGFWLKGIDRKEDQAPSSHKTTYTFTRGSGVAEIRVDLQSLIIGENFAVSIADNTVWDRVTEISLMTGDRVPSLAAEDLLIALCIHGAKHLWEKTKWICDVVELIQRHEDSLNWQLVSQQANRLGGGRMLELGLRMAQIFKQPRDSREALSQVPLKGFRTEDQSISATAFWLTERLFDQGKRHEKDFKRKAFYLYLQDGVSGNFRHYVYLCLLPLPQKYWCLLPHPRRFGLLNLFVVVFRTCGKYGLRSPSLNETIARWLNLVRQS